MWYVYRSTSVVQEGSFQGSSILCEHVFPGRHVQKIVSPRTLEPTLTVTQRTQQHLYMVLGILVCTGLVAQLQWLASGPWSQLTSILLWCWTQTYEPYLCCPTHASPSALSIFYLPLFHIDQHPQSLEIEQLTPTILTLHLQHSHHSPLTFTHHWPLTTLTPSFYFILPHARRTYRTFKVPGQSMALYICSLVPFKEVSFMVFQGVVFRNGIIVASHPGMWLTRKLECIYHFNSCLCLFIFPHLCLCNRTALRHKSIPEHSE